MEAGFEHDVFDVLRTLSRLAGSRVDKGRRFERLMKFAFLRHPGEYGPSRFSEVWLWSEWPERAARGYGADIGIDLVARQTDAYGGGLCAIQCKFHEGVVPTSGVNSFLAASSAPEFNARILVATSRLTRPAHTKIRKARPRCELLLGSHLGGWRVRWGDFLDRPEDLAFDDIRYEPHPYQREAVDKVEAGFWEHDRGKLVLPCGTGKSVVALWIAERVAGRGGRVLYLVPSIALMGQTMREWARQRDPKIPHRYIGVCSDVKAGRNAEDADLAELAMPVTTDPARISAQLAPGREAARPVEAPVPATLLDQQGAAPSRGGAGPADALTVAFCTYQSLPLVAEAQAAGAASFDLAVCDEAHRTTGIHESAAGGSAFTLIHSEERVWADRRLYMTATPRVYTTALKARVRKHAKDFDVYSMDDDDVYGPEFYRLSFGDAVDGGFLSDYRVAVIAVDEDSMRAPFEMLDVGDDRWPVNLHDAVKIVGCWDALADPTTRTVRDRVTGARSGEHAARRAIAFANTIRSSQRAQRYWRPVIESMNAGGGSASSSGSLLDCDIRHVDGRNNALERADVIDWLRKGDDGGACRIVTNARCLTEGVDVPALDAVMFLESRRSQIDVVQAVGRVMRTAPGKKCGYVVLPVVVPTGSSLTDDDVLNGSDFKPVWDVLKALRSHDERVDVWINTADLGAKTPVEILTNACGACGGFGCDEGPGCPAGAELKVKQFVQGRLPLESAIASKLVEKCGDRQYWDRWAQSVAEIAARVTARIDGLVRGDAELATAFRRFLKAMRTTVGSHVTTRALTSMLAQHLVTQPVFDALFAGSGFVDRNPISKALNELLGEFKAQDVRLADETRDLDRFYNSVEARLKAQGTSEARLRVMLDVYERFFKKAMPEQVSQLGIAYTPVELVDFILRSADAVLRQEFGRGLTNADVHILDPFTGTGTFINRLITQTDADGEYLIRDEDLARKFTGSDSDPPEIHANEIVLLAYYLAAVKTEEGYRERQGEYEPFEGIVLTDTFEMGHTGRLPGTEPLAGNSDRAQQQSELPIQVILGNPPWSAGQKSSGDDNPNLRHPRIAERVRATYGRRHKEVTGRGAGKSAGNLYVQAIRWASDRLNPPDDDGTAAPGVVAFVHPNSLTNGTSLAGMRAALRDEFTCVYVVNLRGDANKSGEERRREKDNVFGQASRNGVQITVLVRNPGKDLSAPAVLRYAEVPEYSSRPQKLEWLKSLEDVTSGRFAEVPVVPQHHWVNLPDGTFDKMLPVCSLSKKNSKLAVASSAAGVISACDSYVYSFSREKLARRMSKFIDAYEDARELVLLGESFEEVTKNEELDVIKWTGALKQTLKRGEPLEFEESRIREVLYRPFTKLWLYEDDRILASVKAIAAMFPRTEIHTHTHTHTSSWLRRTPEQSSERSQPTDSSTFAQSERISHRGLLPAGDNDRLSVEHGDLRNTGSRNDSGFSRHGTGTADEGDAPKDVDAMMPKTGSPKGISDALVVTNGGNDTVMATSTLGDFKAALAGWGGGVGCSSAGGDHDHWHIEHGVSGFGSADTAGSGRDQGLTADASAAEDEPEAMMLNAGSTRGTADALTAAGVLPDFNTLRAGGGRVLIRRWRSC